jgi:SAM-dependent methyltransferase
MEASIDELKERARKTWSAGDFDDIAQMFPGVGEHLVARAEISPGMKVLDVACGTGAATIPAALAGGVCTGLDLIPAMLDTARVNADEAGVQIDWVEGDAEDLPFGDESFDRVLSQFGVMFAPRHEVTAAELARVCVPGGTVAVANWTPEGMIGDMFKTIGSRLPAPPPSAKPPILWGSEDHARSLLEPHGLDVSSERAMAVFRGQTVDEIVTRFEINYGPWKMAQAALGDGWAEVRSDLVELFGTANDQSANGNAEVFAEYLVVTATKAG